jgi:excisionase family DNA binding protein
MPKRGRSVRPAAVRQRTLPMLRFEIAEAAEILRMSRAQLYHRIAEGAIHAQKDGGRTYITRVELERYVESCNGD